MGVSSSDSQATLPANYTFTGTDAGVHVFTVTLNTIGTQTITATDTINSTIKGTTSGITVAAATLDAIFEEREAEERDASPLRELLETPSAAGDAVALLNEASDSMEPMLRSLAESESGASSAGQRTAVDLAAAAILGACWRPQSRPRSEPRRMKGVKPVVE